MLNDIHDSNFEEEIKGKVAVVDFWADWCGPCVGFAPFFKEASEKSSISFYKCNVDANQKSGAKYNVQSIPTLIIFKDGEEVERIQGGMAVDALLQHLKKYEDTQ